MTTALITGVTGQDGSYLAEFLRGRGYRVVGSTRDSVRALRLPHAAALTDVEMVADPLVTLTAAKNLLEEIRPDEVYHFAAPSRIPDSWADPEATRKAILGATAILLEAIQDTGTPTRCFLAGSCEIFAPSERAQSEAATRGPTSPYGKAKLAAHDLARTYRQDGGLYVVNGILFNHESPRRGPGFVTARIARGVADIALGRKRELRVGNLDVRRDWGFAGDFVRAMWLSLQEEEPTDYVLGTGAAHSVAELCEQAFQEAGLDWRDHVVSDPALVRADDVALRLADPGKARRRLGWSPEVDFRDLVSMMVRHELDSGSDSKRSAGHQPEDQVPS